MKSKLSEKLDAGLIIWKQIVKTSCKEAEVDSSAYYILDVLITTNLKTANEVAARLEIKPSTISRQINKLVEQKWVAKEQVSDKRVQQLVVTKKGYHHYQKVIELTEQKLNQILEIWTEEEIVQFRILLNRFTVSYQDKLKNK